MPQVLPLIVAWTQTSVVGWIFGAVVKMAAAYAISRALSPKPGKLGSMGNPITMSRDAAAARRVIYGQTRASGPIIFAHVTGAKNSDLHLVIALAGHKLAEIGDILINDEIVALDVDGNATTSKYVGKLRVRKWLGDQTTADALLVSESGGVWTSAHVCQDIACIYAKLVFDQDVFPQGIPNISAIVKGREVYDPRDESTAWTDNPALCALDYMRDTDVGFAATDGEIDYASHAAAASICDESVALAAGGTEKRYRCAGVFATDGEPASIVEQLVGTMSGTMVYSGGKFSLKAGAYEIPTVEFDESHLRGPIQFQTDSSRREVCNVVKGTYTSPADLYQPRDFPQWVDAAAVTADEEEITRDLALDWVHSAAQAQRIAAIEERASRLGGTIILQCNLSGLRVQVGDTITVKNARFGWTAGEVFKVVQFRFSAGEGAVGVDLTCRRTASSVYAWVSTSESAVTPGAIPDGGEEIYTIPGALDTEPGTIPELSGTAPAVPSVGYAIEAAGGSKAICGWPEYSGHESSPPKFYRNRTLSGAYVGQTRASGLYVNTATYAYSGVAITATSGASCTITQSGSMHNTMLDHGGTTTDYGTSAVNEVLHGVSPTGTTTYTATTATSTGNDVWQDLGNQTEQRQLSSSSAVETLSGEVSESSVITDILAENEWVASAISATASRNIRATGSTVIYNKLRFRASVQSGQTIQGFPGCEAWSPYSLSANVSRAAINEAGTVTGSWVAASPVVLQAFADGDGFAAFPDWAEIVPVQGYATRIDSITLEAK